MEAKEKAEELVKKMYKANWKMTSYSAVSCAMVCVDEILHDAKQSYKVTEEPDIHPHAQGLIVGTIRYWQEVKQELEKMKV
ncbi:hypothetical protein [Elizabethkingia anophelis]|uniref:hypothetical protein n=1 Tax=Elizabethkingia anophelis TaxID=1117645 RepID=UPI0038916E58